jgi:hypothetical protein
MDAKASSVLEFPVAELGGDAARFVIVPRAYGRKFDVYGRVCVSEGTAFYGGPERSGVKMSDTEDIKGDSLVWVSE